jgi:hypothetical protein
MPSRVFRLLVLLTVVAGVLSSAGLANATTGWGSAQHHQRHSSHRPPTPTPTPTPTSNPGSAGTTYTMYVTGFGTGDNDPPGSRAIAYPGSAPRHSQAGGQGSYADPVTVAVGTDGAGVRLNPGVRVYIPRFSKYGVIEDECASCSGKWIDVFDGSTAADAGNLGAVADCQDRHTGNYAVEVNPPAGRAVVTTQLYAHGVCAP